MNQGKPLVVNLGRLLTSVTIASLAVAAVGAYPTWLLGGRAGLLSEAIAASVVGTVMIASAIVVVRAARRSATAAMMTFLAAGAARMILSALAVGAVILITNLPAAALLAWLLVFYLATLAAEGAWLSRAMRESQDNVETDSGD